MMRIGELEIGQDLKFQKRSWRVERIGWIVGALILVAALAGLLGPGPLSKARAASSDNTLTVEYNKYERYQAPVELRVQVDARVVKDGKIQLWIDRKYVEALQMERIQPEPESVAIDGERFLYVFKAHEAPEVSRVNFQFQPNKFGKTQARLGAINGPSVEFRQFFFP